MLHRALVYAGLDARQLRALVSVGIKLDLRGPGAAQGGSSGVPRLLAIAAMNLVLGLALGAIALYVPDVFVSGSLVLSVTMFLVAVSIVMEFAVVVISPADYEILGCQPISGTTYLAARVANILFYTTVITTTLALLPMAGFFFARGFDVRLGLAGIAAVYLGCLTTTLAVVALYVATARLVPAQRLRRALTYLQLVASFSIYAAYFVLPQVFRPNVLSGWTVRKTWVMLLYPPTWFASYLDIAVGKRSALELLPAIAGVIALVGLLVLVAGRLSLDYSEVLSRQASRSEPPARRRRFALSPLFFTGERRAVALLVRAQFRHDHRFRLGVLSMVPLSVFYLLLALKDEPLADPFVRHATGHGATFLYFVAVFMPMMLLLAVGRSDAYRAAWVFHVTPARPATLILAAKDLVVACLLVPYLLALTLLLSYVFGSVPHAFVHMFIQGLIANLILLAMVGMQPVLPFSQPVQKGQFTAGYIVVALVGGIAQPLSSAALSRFIYPYPAMVAVAIVLLVAATIGGQRLLRRRLRRVTSALEFVG